MSRGNKPDVAEALAVHLSSSRIARIGIQGMAVIRDLAAVGIVHQTERTWKHARDAGHGGTQDWGPCARATPAANGGRRIRGAIVEGHSLRIRKHRQRLAAHGQGRGLNSHRRGEAFRG